MAEGRRRWWREPLLHFAILGAFAFLAHRLVFGPPQSEHVRPEDAPIGQIRQDWFAVHGSLPSVEQEAALIDDWVEEEVLYRRAITLGIDQNDTIVRRRLVQRMRFLLEDTHRFAPPTDAQLQAWLEAHPERFAQPTETTFEHVFFSRGKRGADLVTDAGSALAALQDDPDATVHGDPFFRGTVFEAATSLETSRAFGRKLADAIEALPIGRWSGPLSSAYGLHLVRVRGRTRPPPPELDAVRDEVERSWTQAERARLNEEALRNLKARYSPPESP